MNCSLETFPFEIQPPMSDGEDKRKERGPRLPAILTKETCEKTCHIQGNPIHQLTSAPLKSPKQGQKTQRNNCLTHRPMKKNKKINYCFKPTNSGVLYYGIIKNLRIPLFSRSLKVKVKIKFLGDP